MKAELKYNPYFLETELKIDGCPIQQLLAYKEFQKYIQNKIPLQMWLDPIESSGWNGLFEELCQNYKSEGRIEVYFEGRELDFQDLYHAIKRCKYVYPDMSWKVAKKITIDDQKVAQHAEILLKKIQSMATANPSADCGPMTEVGQKLDFSIVFAGLYSSGKSTLLNAIMGKQILPVANGTCTSKVFRIWHKSGVPVAEMQCIAKDPHGGGQVVRSRQSFSSERELQEALKRIFPGGKDGELLPSVPPDIDEVHMDVDLSRLYPPGWQDKLNLVLVDTPGTNSGIGNALEGTRKHFDITMDAIKSGNMVVLVATGDDYQNDSIDRLLREIDRRAAAKGEIYRQQLMFVLNKCDCVRYSKGENIQQTIRAYRNYISKNRDSLKAAPVFPAAAQVALAVRTGLTEKSKVDSKMAQGLYRSYAEFLDSCEGYGAENYRLEKARAAPARVRKGLEDAAQWAQTDKNCPLQAEIHSGVPSLELAIQHYIERYAYPLKLQILLEDFQDVQDSVKCLLSSINV